MHLVLLPILGLHVFTIRFNGYGIREVKKNNFPTDRPISEKQGRVRGNKNIFKAGPTDYKTAEKVKTIIQLSYCLFALSYIQYTCLIVCFE